MATVYPTEDEKIEYYEEDAPMEHHSPGQSRELNEEEQAKQMKLLLKQVAMNRRMDQLERMFSYDYIKESTVWFLDTASCNINISVGRISQKILQLCYA